MKRNRIVLALTAMCTLSAILIFSIVHQAKDKRGMASLTNSQEGRTDTVTETDKSEDSDSVHKMMISDHDYFEELMKDNNTVKGHKEESVITGNFTGHGIDTLYVDTVYIYDKDIPFPIDAKYYAKSNNPRIPKIKLYGCPEMAPKLVYEGDVDGDGKDEWGYLCTWVNSQWRTYYIFNFNSKTHKWRFLYDDPSNCSEPLLFTPQYLRLSGVDIVEKGPRPGTIKISYSPGNMTEDIIDTIVKPTYTPITKKNY